MATHNPDLGIAEIVRIRSGSNQFQGRILFDECLTAHDYFFRGAYGEIFTNLTMKYPNLKVVSTTEFRTELDHIKLFGERSKDEDDYTPPIEEVQT